MRDAFGLLSLPLAPWRLPNGGAIGARVMGFNTTVFILNDQFNRLEKDPEGFVKEISRQMNYGGDIMGQHHVIRTEHADVPKLYLTHGNWISDLTPYFIRDEIKKSTNPKMVIYLKERCVQAQRMLRDSIKQLNKIIEENDAES